MSLATKTYQNSYSTNIGQLLLPMLGQRNCCLSHPDSGESALQTLVFLTGILGARRKSTEMTELRLVLFN